jgi:hypothetical protein
VARAIELGRSSTLRAAWRREISERKTRIFQDASPVRDLEQRLLQHYGRS